MFKLYSVSIRACNRYQCIPVVATLQYAHIVYFYGLFIRSVHNRQVLRLTYRIHTHIHYIILGMLIAYRTKLLSPLSSKTRASASWLTIPLFIFRLFPVCGSVPRSHRGKLFQYVKYLFVLPTLQTYGVFD